MGEYDCFRLGMEFIEDKEKLRALLTQVLATQQELQEKVAELHAQLDSMKGDIMMLSDVSNR